MEKDSLASARAKQTVRPLSAIAAFTSSTPSSDAIMQPLCAKLLFTA